MQVCLWRSVGRGWLQSVALKFGRACPHVDTRDVVQHPAQGKQTYIHTYNLQKT